MGSIGIAGVNDEMLYILQFDRGGPVTPSTREKKILIYFTKKNSYDYFDETFA